MFGRKKGRQSVDETEGSDEFLGDGPHDRRDIIDVPEYYTAIEFGHLDLGAMAIGVPKGWQLNVALNQQGQPEFHIVSKIARIIPHVYSAPKSSGQWRTWVADLKESLEGQQAKVAIEDGQWGRELVADLPNAALRVVGCDGPRWMAEVRIVSTMENAPAAAEEGREILAHLIVDRGTDPMPVKEPLPLTIPEEMQKALAQAQQQVAAQKRAQAQQGQGAQQAQPGQAKPGQAQPGQAQKPSQPQNPSQARPQGAPSTPPRQASRGGSAMDSLRESGQ